ncbi:MAG: transcription elongation factor GreA [Ruminococcaceae bacterium]|nr:transcription elongation factor GreA [Oscillospiraceae bacterium]
MLQETLLTAEGLKQLQDELEQLKTVGRKEAAEKIKVARSYGDLSENSEYDEAMSDQAKLEARISEIENLIKNAKIYDENAIGTEAVHIGSKVTVTNTAKKKKMEFKIVGFAQADPANGKISDESPIGKALIGHKVGNKVEVETPNGVVVYKINSIDK